MQNAFCNFQKISWVQSDGQMDERTNVILELLLKLKISQIQILIPSNVNYKKNFFYLDYRSICLPYTLVFLIIGTRGRRCSRLPLGGRLATTIVDRYFHHYFPFSIFSIFFFVATFSHRRSVQIKKLI